MSSPTRIGDYEIVRLLSTGGMGELFLARRSGPAGFTTTVVLKRILRHLVNDAATVELFVREARIAALLSHANVVRTFELGQQGEDYFIIMEYVRGRSLRAVHSALRKRGLSVPIPIAVGICQQALRGLQHAHAITDEQGRKIGIVHRDVSPDNLLVGFDGSVKLADFGVAKAGLLSPETIPGTLKGKLAFAAPEQLLHRNVDARADLYALGAVLYELLTGHLPFEAESERAYFVEGPTAAIKPLREWNAEIPEALESVILHALAKDREARIGSAEALDAALGEALHPERPADSGALSQFLAALFPEGREAADSIVAETAREAALHVGTAAHGTAASGTATPAASDSAGSAVQRTGSPERGGRRWAIALGSAAVLGALVWFGISARTPEPLELKSASVKATESALSVPTPLPEPLPAATPSAADAGLLTAVVKTSPVLPAPLTPQKASPPKKARVRAASETKPAAVSVEPAQLSIRASPWADVELDSRPLGQTPIAAFAVKPGRHTLVLRNPELGAVRTLQLTLAPGEDRVVKEDLRPGH